MSGIVRVVEDFLMYIFTSILLDLIYPRICYGCGRSLGETSNIYLCLGCWRKIEIIKGNICQRCGFPLGPYLTSKQDCLHCRGHNLFFARASGAALYKGLIRDLMHSYKYEGKRSLVYPFSRLILSHLNRYPYSPSPEAVVAVPMFSRDEWDRGYNQSELLAIEVSRHLHLPYLKGVLIKVCKTSRQAYLSRSARQNNLEKAFAIKKAASIQGKILLLVDDVITTGSTASECAHTLKKGGAKMVYVVTIGRA